MDRKVLDEKWNTDEAVKIRSEVKELQKQVHDLQQQLSEACDSDVEAKRRCQHLVKYWCW